MLFQCHPVDNGSADLTLPSLSPPLTLSPVTLLKGRGRR